MKFFLHIKPYLFLVKWLHKQFSGIYIKRNKILGCLLGVLKGTMNKQSKAVHFRLIGDMDGFFFVKNTIHGLQSNILQIFNTVTKEKND
jgi:hypothetical protein